MIALDALTAAAACVVFAGMAGAFWYGGSEVTLDPERTRRMQACDATGIGALLAVIALMVVRYAVTDWSRR